VDRLLLDPRFRLVAVVAAVTDERLECALARAIGRETVAGFGATDCRCASHLAVRSRDPVDEIRAAFRANGLVPTVVGLKNDFEKAMVTGEDD
jgi:Uri superfamily endonuclease